METPEYSLNGPFPLASFWVRLFARSSYYFIAPIGGLLLFITDSTLLSLLLGFIFGSLVDAYVGAKLGAPLGEFIFMLKTVDIKTGVKADTKQLFRRNIFQGIQGSVFFIIFGFIGYIVYKVTGSSFIDILKNIGLHIPFLAMLGSPYKQALYDLSAGVIVVNTSPFYHPRYPLQILPEE
jgi:hypothetical protein